LSLATKTTFAGCEVVSVNIGAIKPYDKNPRKNETAVQAVANSIKQFGFRQPIVVDKGGVIIVGHTRYKAAKLLGMTEVPVVYADMKPSDAKAYRLADNKTGELATWDYDELDKQLSELSKLEDLNMSAFGFDESDADSEPREVDFGEAIISYEIIFDTQEQYDAWRSFLKYLRSKYEASTIGERLSLYIAEMLKCQG